MNRLNFMVLLPFLPVILGKSTVVINRIINDEEIPLNNSKVEASSGETLKFSCYVEVALENKTYRHYDINWQIPGYTAHVKKSGHILDIEGVNMIHRGHYVCVYQMSYIPVQDFYLEIRDQPDYFNVQNTQFNPKSLVSMGNERREWHLPEIPKMKLTDLINPLVPKVPNLIQTEIFNGASYRSKMVLPSTAHNYKQHSLTQFPRLQKPIFV